MNNAAALLITVFPALSNGPILSRLASVRHLKRLCMKPYRAAKIPFYYLNDLEINIPEIELIDFFQADFILPNQRIIIEVQGAHWHSMTKTIEEDALKFAYYQQMGWKPLAWWDYDILDNVNKLFDQVPELLAASAFTGTIHSTELTPMRRTKTDSSQVFEL
jgi:very-short-patch-repair endonuclease